MKEFEIRKAQLHDIAICSQIERLHFSEPWSEKSMSDALEDENSLFYVLLTENKVIGYYIAGNICDEINLYTIAIAENFKGYGFGNALLLHLIKLAKTQKAYFIGLEVRVSNIAAIALYEKNGFVKNGKRPDFYKKPTEDAYLYTLYLTNEESE